MEELKPFPNYKDTNLHWLEQIPEHWTIYRNKLIFQEIIDPSKNGSEDLLTVSQYTGVTRRKERFSNDNMLITRAASLVGYKRVQPNDLVMNIMLAWNGSLGVSSLRGITSPAYCVFRAKMDVHQKYLHYLLRTPLFTGVFKTVSTGVIESRLRLYPDAFFRLSSLLPPKNEQELIARFLDYYEVLISRYIKVKQKQIKLLDEKKQAIIQDAVTRGLDSSIRFKASGVDWLIEIPAHWDTLRSKFVFREIDKRSSTGRETHLSMSQKLGLVPSSMIEERRLMSESYVGTKICEKNDIVLNRLKAHLGVFALAPQQGLVSPDYTIFRAIRKINPRYFELLMRTPAFRVELRKRAKGIVQGFWRLYTDDFYDINLIIPPLEEQNAIIAYLEDELLELNRVIERVNSEIRLTLEYRTRLITDVVTGKLDVREAAKNLPEIETLDTPESATIEDLELSDELEDAEEIEDANE